MSEKYSTDDLILWITVSCDINAIKTECDVTDECPECERQRDAIIARLRAADAICAEWRAWRDNPTKGMAAISKAIAEYEGRRRSQMSVPEMGLSEDGKKVWYRHNGVFWDVFPGDHKYWGVRDPITTLEGFGDTIPKAVLNALRK